MNIHDSVYKHDLLSFAQDLIRIKSFSGQEDTLAKFIAERMKHLGFNEVRIDSLGNVLGSISSGSKSILFESHMDTVQVHDADQWIFPPFCGDIKDGFLLGRGSADMKSGLAASVFAAVLAREAGYLSDKVVHVSCSIYEEDCDGEGIKNMLQEFNFKPDFAVICEPSSNNIALGHNGKAQIVLKTHGASAHGSAPEMGINAVYEMAEIIQRVEQLNTDLASTKQGTLVLSQISSKGVSLNAVPEECTIYLDRRLIMGETEGAVQDEMNRIISGKHASWEIDTIHRTSWTKKPITYKPLHMAWQIDREHHLTKSSIQSYKEIIGSSPEKFINWDFSTNAVALIPLGIPCIGFGPGDPKLAHMRNEKCAVNQILDACDFYADLVQRI